MLQAMGVGKVIRPAKKVFAVVFACMALFHVGAHYARVCCAVRSKRRMSMARLDTTALPKPQVQFTCPCSCMHVDTQAKPDKQQTQLQAASAPRLSCRNAHATLARRCPHTPASSRPFPGRQTHHPKTAMPSQHAGAHASTAQRMHHTRMPAVNLCCRCVGT